MIKLGRVMALTKGADGQIKETVTPFRFQPL